jgi:pSer/pThr/pTyr-binding forkhead associated (FHA) protein
MKVVVIKGSEDIREFRLHDGMNSIGRGITNRIRLLDPRVSRKHCKIRKVGLSLFLSDLGTKNGTQVNGQPVHEQELKLFDEIKVGKTVLKIVEEDYSPEAVIRMSPRSFLRNIVRIIRKKEPLEPAAGEFAKFPRKRRKRLWRPRVDTEPPEGDSETIFSHTDPDS